MKPTSMLRAFLLGCGSWLALPAATANTLYWDGGTVNLAGNGDFVASGLTGNWSTSLLNWDAGPVPYTGWNNSNNDIAFFHRGTAIPGPNPGTVSLTSGITVGGLVFNASTFTISTGANALTFGGTNNTVALNNSATAANITGTIGSSSANLIFTAQNPLATHTFTFNGTNTSGWTGTTTVNSGMTLAVEGSTGNRALGFTSGITLNGGTITTGSGVTSAHNTVNFFNDSAAITVNGGGSFTWRPVNANTFNETIGAITVNSGQFNLLTASQSGPGLATLTTAGITRTTTTSVLNFSLGNNGPLPSTGGTNFIQVSGSGTTTGWTSGDPSNSIIGAWATTGTTGSIDYAIYSADRVRSANTVASLETTWTDAAKQYTLSIPTVTTSGASTALTASRDVTSLRAFSTTTNLSSATANGSPTFTLTGHTLAVGDPVVLGGTAPSNFSTGRVYYVQSVGTDIFTLSATPGGAAINAGNAQSPNVTTGLKLDLNKNLGTTGLLNGGTAPIGIGRTADGGQVTLPVAGNGNLFVTPVAGAIGIDAPVVDNGGALTLVKSGTGNLFLTSDNTFTGGTVVNAGNVTVSGTNTFATGASGADVIDGGTLTYSTIASWGGAGRDVTFNGTGTLTSTVGGYSGGTLTTNAGANAVIANPSGGTGGISFATTTGAGNVIYSTSANRLLNLGDASGLTGNLQARLTNNANYTTSTTVQFSAIADAAGSALQFAGGTGDGNQAMTFSLVGTSPLVFNNRQIQIQDRLTSNWEVRDNIIANNNANAAHTWTINTNLLYTGGRAITAFGGSLQTGRRFILSGSNAGDNAFTGVIGDGQNANGLLFEKAGAGRWILSGANTYTGTTTISGGTLVGIGANAFGSTSGITTSGTPTLSLRCDTSTGFVKASDSTPYSLTTSTTGVTLNVDQATAAGTAAKTMSFGHITTSSTAATYQFNFTGANNTSLSAGTLDTSVSTGAAVHTINNSIAGGGSLTLASVFNRATIVASPNLVFTGTGTTVVTGAITQTLSDMDLIKNGAGTLLLNGVNTYTGLTEVNAGTLGGTGTIAGSVTVAAAGSLAPGASAGTLSIGGGLDLSAQVNGGAGKLKFELGANTATSDQLAVTGALTTGGQLGFSDFTFTSLPGGPQNGIYTLITTGADPTGLLDGADLSGTIGAGGTGTLGTSGNNIILTVTGLGGGTPYQNWATGGELFDDDANNDGVSNGLAFLLGASGPNVNALGKLPTITESAGGLVLVFDMLDAASRGTATLSVEHSSALGVGDPWEAALVPDADNTVNDVVFDIEGTGTLDVEATIPVSKAAAGRLFGRLKATE
jgi:autotransporter-associated beta strand protein